MKLHTTEPTTLMRVRIHRLGDKTERLVLTDTTLEETIEFLRKLIETHAPPFIEGKRTSIEVRECISNRNGKSKSVSFYGLTPTETLNLIKNNL